MVRARKIPWGFFELVLDFERLACLAGPAAVEGPVQGVPDGLGHRTADEFDEAEADLVAELEQPVGESADPPRQGPP
jgi:hypothetical protein